MWSSNMTYYNRYRYFFMKIVVTKWTSSPSTSSYLECKTSKVLYKNQWFNNYRWHGAGVYPELYIQVSCRCLPQLLEAHAIWLTDGLTIWKNRNNTPASFWTLHYAFYREIITYQTKYDGCGGGGGHICSIARYCFRSFKHYMYQPMRTSLFS